MQTIEHFLQEYFRDRTELLRQSCAGWNSHIGRFFASNYQPYDREKTVAHSEAEKIISVSKVDASTEVITTGSAGGHWRFRYRVQAVGVAWHISSMDMECGICHGSGKSKNGQNDCKLCMGAGWNLVGEMRNA